MYTMHVPLIQYHCCFIHPPPLPTHTHLPSPQNTNIDRLTKEMKQLKLIPLSWRPSDVTSPLRAARSPRSPASSPRTPTKLPAEPRGAEEGGGELSGRGLNGDVMQTPVIDRMLNSKRLAELRESLGAITQTPVRTLQRGTSRNHTLHYNIVGNFGEV